MPCPVARPRSRARGLRHGQKSLDALDGDGVGDPAVDASGVGALENRMALCRRHAESPRGEHRKERLRLSLSLPFPVILAREVAQILVLFVAIIASSARSSASPR